MSDKLTQDDYKRFEELLEEMIKEADIKRLPPASVIRKIHYSENARNLRKVLKLIKERQNLTLNKNHPLIESPAEEVTLVDAFKELNNLFGDDLDKT